MLHDPACPSLRKVPHVLVIHGEDGASLELLKVVKSLKPFISSCLFLFLIRIHAWVTENEACKLDPPQTSTPDFIWNTSFQGHAACISSRDSCCCAHSKHDTC